MKNKILVHICCGVDAVWGLRKLKMDFPEAEIKGFFYDPNIHPEEEYELRWIETLRICKNLGIECIKGDYDPDRWIEITKGLEDEPERGKRCNVCHDLRLEKTALMAKKIDFDSFTTVLLMSPKKDFDTLKNIGEMIGKKYGLEFLAVEFRKKGGIEKMNSLSKEYQIYHQNYCGCIYALFQQRKDKKYVPELVSFGKGRPAGSREELIFIKKLRLFCEDLGLKVYEERFKFIGWRLIRSVLMVNKEPIHHNVLPYSSSLKGILRARPEQVLYEENKKILKLNKGNIQIWITENPEALSLKEPKVFTDPVFVIDRGIPDGDDVKFEIQLETEFVPDAISTNLTIGEPEAESFIELFSDTLPQGNLGYSFEQIRDIILMERDKILSGEVSVLIYGAEHYGRLGRRYYKKREKSLKKL